MKLHIKIDDDAQLNSPFFEPEPTGTKILNAEPSDLESIDDKLGYLRMKVEQLAPLFQVLQYTHPKRDIEGALVQCAQKSSAGVLEDFFEEQGVDYQAIEPPSERLAKVAYFVPLEDSDG